MAKKPVVHQDYASGLLALLLPPGMQKYWESLGRFVATFASLEVNMQLALWTFTRLPRPMARALLSGSTRIDAAMTLISKIAQAQKWNKSKKRELNNIFSQLGIINKLRNDLLHYGATTKGPSSEWTVSNRAVEDTKKRIRITKISTEILNAMTSDALTIELRLVLLAWGDLMQPKTRRSFQKARHEPWQYKPPRRAAHGRRHRKVPPAQQRQP